MTPRAFVCGLSGTELTPPECAFLSEWQPAGVILFARNVETPSQAKALVSAVKHLGGEKKLIFVDQEGGRVQRLGPPHWRRYPPAATFEDLHRQDQHQARDALHVCARAIAHDLHGLGINAACAPVLDVPARGAHDIIGDRAYGSDASRVAELGAIVVRALMQGGVLPVVKHIPGHGRATADSHFELPVVNAPLSELRASDFVPFRALARAPMAMTAHVIFSAIDAASPATTSKRVVEGVIRGEIGFGGLLLTDDLSMKALSGPLVERAERSFEAGCDLALHCNGNLAEALEVARSAPVLSGTGLARLQRAVAALDPPEPFDDSLTNRILASLPISQKQA